MSTKILSGLDLAADDGTILTFRVTSEDFDRFQALTPGDSDSSIVVTNHETGDLYRVRRWPCMADCFCWSAMVRLTPEDVIAVVLLG
jgi:hypothetical protein